MALAFASILSGTPLPDAVAALGEIALHGRVLGVDRLQERLAGAQRAGIRDVLLPERNRNEAEAAQKAGKAAGLKTTFVMTVQQAVQIALPAVAGAQSGAEG